MTGSSLSWRCFLFVEPVLLLYACGFFMSMPVQKQFIYSRYSDEVGFPFSLDSKGKSGCGQGNNVQNNTLKLLENKVQELTSGFNSLVMPCQFLPSSIMGLFIGPWTDSAGRKPALLLAIMGAAIEALIVIGVMFNRWPLYLLLIGKVVNAMTGFFSGMAQTTFAYVFDTTDHSNISTRLAVLQLVIFTGGFLGQAFSGVFMSAFGFIRPYVGLLLCFTASFVYCLFIVPESRQITSNRQGIASLFNMESLKRVFRVFTVSRPSSKRRNLFILMAINAIFFSLAINVNNLLMLYLIKSPICLTTTGLGGYFAFKFACEGLGGVVGVIVLKKRLSEENIFRIGFVSLSLSHLFTAYVYSQNMAFIVPVISSISGILMPLLKGAISNLVKPEEQGATNTAVSVSEALVLVLASIVFNKMYIYASEADSTYLVFLASGVLAWIPIAMISALQKPKED